MARKPCNCWRLHIWVVPGCEPGAFTETAAAEVPGCRVCMSGRLRWLCIPGLLHACIPAAHNNRSEPPPLYLVGGAVGELLGLRGGSRVPLWW